MRSSCHGEGAFLIQLYNWGMEKRIENLGQLSAEASAFARGLRPRTGSATLITLSGELGAGKTAFTKALALALGVDEAVTSPTFVLEKIYELENQNFKRLVHIDAYRLESGVDLAPLGFDEIMQDSVNLVVLEWPEKVVGVLPSPAVVITLEALPDGTRTINYG